MTAELNRANKNFQEILKRIKSKKKIDNQIEALLYLCYISGFKDGCGEVQLAC